MFKKLSLSNKIMLIVFPLGFFLANYTDIKNAFKGSYDVNMLDSVGDIFMMAGILVMVFGFSRKESFFNIVLTAVLMMMNAVSSIVAVSLGGNPGWNLTGPETILVDCAIICMWIGFLLYAVWRKERDIAKQTTQSSSIAGSPNQV